MVRLYTADEIKVLSKGYAKGQLLMAYGIDNRIFAQLWKKLRVAAISFRTSDWYGIAEWESKKKRWRWHCPDGAEGYAPSLWSLVQDRFLPGARDCFLAFVRDVLFAYENNSEEEAVLAIREYSELFKMIIRGRVENLRSLKKEIKLREREVINAAVLLYDEDLATCPTSIGRAVQLLLAAEEKLARMEGKK